MVMKIPRRHWKLGLHDKFAVRQVGRKNDVWKPNASHKQYRPNYNYEWEPCAIIFSKHADRFELLSNRVRRFGCSEVPHKCVNTFYFLHKHDVPASQLDRLRARRPDLTGLVIARNSFFAPMPPLCLFLRTWCFCTFHLFFKIKWHGKKPREKTHNRETNCSYGLDGREKNLA